jgi:hypothetical protein
VSPIRAVLRTPKRKRSTIVYSLCTNAIRSDSASDVAGRVPGGRM